jgi:hypothetical protein
VRRFLLPFLLSFALLGLQHETAVHAFAHYADRQADGLTAPHAALACTVCELLASGGDGAPATFAASALPGAPPQAAATGFATRAVAAPAVYASRAPPVLS